MQVIDQHSSLEPVQDIPSLCIKSPKIINANVLRVILRNREKVSLYSM